jgi:hypothetical protein
MITNASWYVTNQTLHEDLNVPYITEEERSNNHHDKIKIHSNTTLWPLLEQQHRRRLKKSWPVDLIDGRRGPLTGEDLIMTYTTLWPLLEQKHRRRLRNSWPVDLIDG